MPFNTDTEVDGTFFVVVVAEAVETPEFSDRVPPHDLRLLAEVNSIRQPASTAQYTLYM